MKKIKAFINRLLVSVKSDVIHDDSRQKVMFIGLNSILCLVAFAMSIVNIFTKEYILMYTTLAFSILCLLNVFLMKTPIKRTFLYICFTLEAMALIGFFFISGIPDGFSALWVCLIPSFALLFFGGKKGSIFCLAEFIIIVFFFWVPFGKSLLQYAYSSTFLLRFPFLYLAIYLLSLLVELIRSQTQKQLIEAEMKYHHLYRHDALTGLYNRYGFNEIVDKSLPNCKNPKLSVIIMDIDDFKQVNDHYGHLAGDEVLKSIAAILPKTLCEHCKYCRWGGEEFMVLMQCEHDPVKTGEQLRSKVEEASVKYKDQIIKVTISLGVCIVSDINKYSINQAIVQADKSLYASKTSGKNKVTVATLE